jgi:single-strand DNA-binding protein
MNEAFVTFQGWVGNDVVYRETKDGPVANLRVGSTPRIRKRGGTWADGSTTWFSVSCWRSLADNVRESVKKGDPVVVHGRMRADVWERQDGQLSTTYVVDAQYVGHDLTRGTSAFLRSQRPERVEEDETNAELKAILHAPVDDLPQLDSFGKPLDDQAHTSAA